MTSINQVMKAFGIFVAILIVTTLLGEWVISREVNPYIQLAATGVWLYLVMRLVKNLYKLIKL